MFGFLESRFDEIKNLVKITFCITLILFIVITPVEADLIDNGDGTVTDSRGILWQKSAEDGFEGTWEEALTWAANLDFAGYDDWRLPCAHNFITGYPDMVRNSIENEWGYLYGEEWDSDHDLLVSISDTAPMEGYTGKAYWTDAESMRDISKAYCFMGAFIEPVWWISLIEKTSTIAAVAVRGPIEAPKIYTPILSSCNSDGTEKSHFTNHRDVYIIGVNFLPRTHYRIRVVDSLSEWYDGMPLPSGSEACIGWVYTNEYGEIYPERILFDHPAAGGSRISLLLSFWKNYDIIVYLGEDVVYQARYDGLDNISGELQAGFRISRVDTIIVAIPVGLLLVYAASRYYQRGRSPPLPG